MVGAGTMGAGIAALAAEASLDTLLYDPDREALARAPDGVEPVRDLEALAPCGLVIEAAPEDLELKRACSPASPRSSSPTACWPPTPRR